nr:MAG TPA: hypothetical protein [Caudoviricetes sp.]
MNACITGGYAQSHSCHVTPTFHELTYPPPCDCPSRSQTSLLGMGNIVSRPNKVEQSYPRLKRP